jgi:2,3-dihydroxyphenylpropionate 1,2-dioxygenase
MTIDHAFSQTIHNMLGGLDARPVIPVFINAIAEPFVPFRRTRLLGEAVGRFAAASGKKVLLLASGGMSHNPRRYYPELGDGSPEITAWQLSGGDYEDSLTHRQYLDLLEVMHHEGAAMIVRGERTAADMKLNAEADERFLEVFCSGRLEDYDAWDPRALVEEAGIGSMELHTWIAAAAAHRAAGGAPPVRDFYAIAPELGIACGIAHGD